MLVNQHPVEQEEVMAYLDGELPSDRAVVVAAHLEKCDECQRFVAELRNVSKYLTEWTVETPGARLRWKPKRAAVWKWGFIGLATAGLAALLIVAPSVFVERKVVPRMQLPTFSAERASPAPMLAKTSQLVLITREFDKSRGALEDILKRHRGYFGQLDVAAPVSGPRTLTATLRVPSDQLDPTTAEIKKLGQVESESQSGEEVTQQYVDLDARLTNARNTEQRLTTLLHDRTGKMSDVLSVEQEIDRVRGSIEQMEAQKKTLVNRVDFATLNVTLREASQAQFSPHSTWTRFRDAASEGYESLVDGVVAVAVFLLAYGPSLFLWGGISLLIARFAWRRWRRLKFGR
jgi:hypothetical protein